MDLQELERYRPIPWGGLKLLAFPALATLWVGAIWIVVLSTSGDLWVNKDAVDGIILLTVAFVVSVFFPLCGLHPITWLKDYWRRNVRGCSIAVFKDDTGNCQVEGPHTPEIIRTWTWGRPSLILPLGGWFNRAYILCAENYLGRSGISAERTLSKWRIELVALHVHAEAVAVRLVDRLGDRVAVSAKDALEILERFSAGLEALTNTWDAVVSHGLEAERVLTRERDEAKKGLGVVEEELRHADSQVDSWITEAHKRLAVIRETVRQLDETRRFIKSKEARRIREWLAAQLRELDPVGECQGGTQPCVPTQDAGV